MKKDSHRPGSAGITRPAPLQSLSAAATLPPANSIGMVPTVSRPACRRVALLLLCLEIAHGLLLSGGGVAQHSRRCTSARQPRTALRMCAANLEPEEPDAGEEDSEERALMPSDWSTLSSRIAEVREAEKEQDEVREKLNKMPHAFVLVFDVDTDDECARRLEPLSRRLTKLSERSLPARSPVPHSWLAPALISRPPFFDARAVYSMEVEDDQGVVLAFESNYDAERYARSLAIMERDAEEDFEEASVQALDLEALVVSSHEADFRVAMVFSGDLTVTSAAELPYIMRESGVEPPPGAVTIAVTLVPEDMYEGKTSDDFVDPAVDTVWVLVHDAGTADAQYFSISVNSTDSVVCFKTEAAALTCCKALLAKGAVLPVPREVMLEEVLDDLHAAEGGGGLPWDVCLVDSMTEVDIDDLEDEDADGDADGEETIESQLIVTDDTDLVVADIGAGSGSSVSKTAAVRDMLDRLYGETGAETDGGASDDDEAR